MSEPLPKAVFLSYAREDADAARRIADALRAFGVEVWFDLSELRGGDVWDQKIRRQIKECGLFMPIISHQSEMRGEGYFRLEWKLAVERTHLLADGMPFLFPIVIDDTSEGDASVPEIFLKSQWTRLPGGEPSPQFIDHVKRILSGSRKPAAARSSAAQPAAQRTGFPLWAAALLGAAVLGLGAFVIFRPAAAPAPAPVAATPITPAAAAAPVVSEKSLAVLPFSNMSEEKDSAFFTDGIQEDILTNLALTPDLRVVSRTSVMQYRNTTKTIRQIAQELGVTYVLEGSVRRAGGKVRVTGQLIRASTDEHVWAKAYDRELSDIFAIQEALASEIAGALKTVISPQQKTIMAGRATTNVEAYNLYLKARDMITWSGVTRATFPEIERLLRSVVQQDPHFVPAWVSLARSQFGIYESATTGGERSRLLAAQQALAQAVALAPEDPTVILAQGRGAQAEEKDEDALRYYERALQLSPGSAEALIAMGSVKAYQRLWPEAMGYLRRAQALDPRNAEVVWAAYYALVNLRQFDQAAQNARLLTELQPGSFNAAAALAIVSYFKSGSRAEMEALYARLSPAQQKEPEVISLKFDWYYHQVGDAAAYIKLSDEQGTNLNFSDDDSTMQYAQALIVAGQRDRGLPLVQPVLARAQAAAAAAPDDYRVLSTLSYAQAVAGDHDGAMKTVDHLLAKLKSGYPLRISVYIQANAAIVCAWVGEKDRAVDLLEPLTKMATASSSSVYSSREDIDMRPLRGYPRWEKILADPAASKAFAY